MAQKKRREFSREYKLEAVKLIRSRGVSIAQAGRDLDVHENVLRKWVKDFAADPSQAFPGQGQMKPEQLEIERLRREVTKLDEPRRKLLGQCGDGEFLLLAEDGTHGGEDIPNERRRQGRRVRLHRALLQSAAATFDAGLCQPDCVRGARGISLGMCPRNRGQLTVKVKRGAPYTRNESMSIRR